MTEAAEMEARGHSREHPLSVSQLNWYVKSLLEAALPSLWAEGEISDLSRPSSGHIYFTLKDDRSQVRAVIWRSTAARLKFQLKDGMAVNCRGSIEVYPPRGSYQLIVSACEPQGVGSLQLALEQLREKLSKEGLFAPNNKVPLPAFPRRVGFVTSPSGAAIHDFLQAASRRWSDFELYVIPARVQGEQAAGEIAAGIRLAQRLRPQLDVVVIGRGGGSLEDLWAFNEEAVVREVAACKIPIVSAVGHEIDVTLSDLAADVRALTPTQAAELVFPSQPEILAALAQMKRRVNKSVWNRLEHAKYRLDSLASRRVLTKPHDLHVIRRQQIDELDARMRLSMQAALAGQRHRLESLARATEALSPLKVLSRGYSLTRNSETLANLRSIFDAEIDQHIDTILADGQLTCQVVARTPHAESGSGVAKTNRSNNE